MIERIKILMEYKGMTSTQFADNVEVPRAVMSHILSGRNKPSLEVVTKIISAFPDVNTDWMMLGEGDMLKSLVEPVVSDIKLDTKASPSSDDNIKINVEVSEVGKVQDERPNDLPAALPQSSEKSVEQIVIFYSDKTFTAYKP